MAEGALDELIELANTEQQPLGTAERRRDSETFQGELGRAATDLRAARASLKLQADIHRQHGLAGRLEDEVVHTQSTQTAIWIVATCVRAAGACFALGGGNEVYDISPLQRRLRDLHTAAQHYAAQPRRYARIGRLILETCLGRPPFLR
jgi:indole-3-acetate monooxygenase